MTRPLANRCDVYPQLDDLLGMSDRQLARLGTECVESMALLQAAVAPISGDPAVRLLESLALHAFLARIKAATDFNSRQRKGAQ